MIRLHHLKANGFRQLRDVNLEIPDRCRVLVEGENEAGKSTLFDAVYFALYGKSITDANLDDLIGNRLEEGVVELEFSADGARLHVTRHLRRGRPSRAWLKITRADGSKEPLDGIRSVNKEILTCMHGLDAEALRHSCYVEQKGLDRFAEELTPDKRQDILLKLLDQDRLLVVRKHFGERAPKPATITHTEKVVALAGNWRALRDTRVRIAELERELRTLELAQVIERRTYVLGNISEENELRARLGEEAKGLEKQIGIADAWREAANRFEKIRGARQVVADLERRIEDVQKQLNELTMIENTALPTRREQRRLLADAHEIAKQLVAHEQFEAEAAVRFESLENINSWETETQTVRNHVASIQDELATRRAIENGTSTQRESVRQSLILANRATALKDWAETSRKIKGDQESLQSQIAELDQQLQLCRLRHQTALTTAAKHTRRRGWTAFPVVIGSGLLVSALVFGLRPLPLLIHPVVVVIALVLAGLASLGLAAWLWAQASHRIQAAQAEAAGHDASARDIERQQSESNGRFNAFGRESDALLAGPRARLAELELAEPDTMDAAEAQARELDELAGVGPWDLDTLERTERDAKAATSEADRQLAVASGELSQREAQLLRLLQGHKLPDYALVAARLTEVQGQIKVSRGERSMLQERLQALPGYSHDLQTSKRVEVFTQLMAQLDGDIRNDERHLRERPSVEGELGRIQTQVLTQQDVIGESLGFVERLRKEHLPIPMPQLGQEGEIAHELADQLRQANLPDLRLKHSDLQRRIGAAAGTIEEDTAMEQKLGNRAWELLAELELSLSDDELLEDAVKRVSGLVPYNSARETSLQGDLRSLQIDEGGLDRRCSELATVLGLPPDEIDEQAERKKLAELLRREHICKLADKVVERARKNLLARMLPTTLEHTRLFLPLLTNNRYRDAELEEKTFRLRVWDAQFGRMVQRELYSGGAQDQFALALRLGFAVATLPQEMGAAPAFIFLDEPVASFDRTRRDAFVQLVREGQIGQRFDQVFISEPEGIFPENPFSHYIRMQAGRVVENRMSGLV